MSEIFQSGPKWWTDRCWHPLSHVCFEAKNGSVGFTIIQRCLSLELWFRWGKTPRQQGRDIWWSRCSLYSGMTDPVWCKTVYHLETLTVLWDWCSICCASVGETMGIVKLANFAEISKDYLWLKELALTFIIHTEYFHCFSKHEIGARRTE